MPEGHPPTSSDSNAWQQEASPTTAGLEQAYEAEEKIGSRDDSDSYIQVLTGYTDAIRSLLQMKGKAPFSLAGLNIYEQLEEIDDALTECLEYRADSLLDQLLSMTRQRVDLKSDYERIRRQQELVYGVAEVLDVESNSLGDCSQTGSEVAQSMQDLMDYYAELVALYPEDQSIIAHIRARTSEWGSGLFYCYEERGSPRTNNSLEQYNDVLKRQRRRVTGRKNVADYIIRHGPYAIFHDPDDQPDDILARFQNVSIGALKKEQAAFHAATRCSRNIRSFRRDPKSYLNKLKALWFKGAP